MTDNGQAPKPDSIRLARLALDLYECELIRYAQRITGDMERARHIVQETFHCSDPTAMGSDEIPLVLWHR